MNKTRQSSNNILISLYQFTVQLISCFILAVMINFAINFSTTMISGQLVNSAQLQKAQDYQMKLNQQYPLSAWLNATISNKTQYLLPLSGTRGKSSDLSARLLLISKASNSPFTNQKFWQASKNKLKPYGVIAMLSLKISLEKILIWLASLPLFLGLGIVGFVDGLIQRSIRRSSGGHESALLYHHAKQLITASLMLSLLCYVALPYPPQWVLLPGALLFGFATFLTTKTFKKYV